MDNMTREEFLSILEYLYHTDPLVSYAFRRYIEQCKENEK